MIKKITGDVLIPDVLYNQGNCFYPGDNSNITVYLHCPGLYPHYGSVDRDFNQEIELNLVKLN